MKKSYTQCKLEKPLQEGIAQQVAWIPSDKAVIGNVIKLKDKETSSWDDGWKVIEASHTRSSEEANERSRDLKSQHRVSDAYRDKDGRWVTPANR